MQEWENYESYEVVDDSNEAQDDEIVEMEGDGEDEPPRKKQKIDNNNNDSDTESESKTKSRFESMANRCKLVDKCDKPIDNILANNINELFRNGMNETLHEEISKQNIVSRPENCEAFMCGQNKSVGMGHSLPRNSFFRQKVTECGNIL